MGQKSIERQLLGLLDRKPDICQPGRLIGHLQNELGEVGSACRRSKLASLEQALSRLEDAGHIQVFKAGKVYNRVIRLP